MQGKNTSSRREALERLSTKELDKLLDEALEREPADAETVRTVMEILWDREKDDPVEITPRIQEAWDRYCRKVEALDRQAENSRSRIGGILRLLTTAAILCLVILLVPQRAGADTLFDKLARWSDSIVEFFSPDTRNDNSARYRFETENTGLQQVYQAVTELGVTTPVVPTWLPEGYELVECKTSVTSQKNGVWANFRCEDNGITFKVDVYGVDVSHEYQRDETPFDRYEYNGTIYTIFQNNGKWVVIWFQENIECFLTLDCREDTLREILQSIYVTEDIE